MWLQADPGGEGEHGAARRGDRKPRQRSAGGPALLPGEGRRWAGLPLHLHHLLHPGLALSAQLRTLHPPPAALAGPGRRQTGTTAARHSVDQSGAGAAVAVVALTHFYVGW